ncbi:four-carbon acid sugar kinase family protein [Phyllobacterium phragmitis]|uniref:Four-carbon acid sugar kinase family protein n=1 Tax=Phyllobacterium phragmitis TaxID=2670329 RepID=A0ABQ0H4N8_9HYPH
MTKLLIIADDLTGALDSAAPFAVRGLRTVIACRPKYLDAALARQAEIVAVSTASREGSIEAARSAVAEVMRSAARVGIGMPRQIFKKIDSRMKGHVRVETLLAAEACGAGRLVVCPAIPAQDRIVQGGAVRGRGVWEPIGIRGIFPAMDMDVLAADAVSDKDLERIVSFVGPTDMLVGAAGLSGALARALAPEDFARTAPHLRAPALLAIGSRDPITLGQIARLREKADPAWIGAPNGITAADMQDGAAITVLQMLPSHEMISGDQANRNFSGTVHRFLDRGVESLLCCGGETADAILASAGSGIIELEGELLPGVPAGMIEIDDKRVLIATKSGGYGDVDCFADIAEGIDFMESCGID